MARKRDPKLATAALAAAVLLVLVWVVVVPVLLQPATGAPTPLQMPSSLPLLALACGGPLLALALLAAVAPLARHHTLHALQVGVVATSLVWAVLHAWVWWDRAVQVHADANIGLGLMVLASPLVIVAAMTVAYQFPGRAGIDSD